MIFVFPTIGVIDYIKKMAFLNRDHYSLKGTSAASLQGFVLFFIPVEAHDNSMVLCVPFVNIVEVSPVGRVNPPLS